MNDDNIRVMYAYHYDRAAPLIPTKQQSDVLKLLLANDPRATPATEIADALNVTIQHANVLLRKLRLNGYVKRTAHPAPTGGIEYHYEVAV